MPNAQPTQLTYCSASKKIDDEKREKGSGASFGEKERLFSDVPMLI